MGQSATSSSYQRRTTIVAVDPCMSSIANPASDGKSFYLPMWGTAAQLQFQVYSRVTLQQLRAGGRPQQRSLDQDHFPESPCCFPGDKTAERRFHVHSPECLGHHLKRVKPRDRGSWQFEGLLGRPHARA